MFDIDTKEIFELERKLSQLSDRAIGYATRNTLNDLGFRSQRFARREISRKMIEKNRWTSKSVRVNKTNKIDISRQAVEIGSTERYMETQEYGGTERKKGKHGVAIPTSAAANQKGANPRTKNVPRGKRIQNIQLARFRKLGKTLDQRLVVAVNMAVRENKRYAFMVISKHARRTGIYRVRGGHYEGRGWPGAELSMQYELSRPSVRIPKTPWLSPAVMIALLRTEMDYERHLLRQFAILRMYD